MKVNIIGGGLAGSEAAKYLLERGYEVHLFERRPKVDDHAHVTSMFGELVCSNSLKSKKLDNACGLLKEEIRLMDSIMMEASIQSEVPSGNALSVDRDAFACFITNKLRGYKNLVIHEEDVSILGDEPTILATGPLTSEPLLKELSKIVEKDNLSFFDASAPIVKKSSINFDKAYFKSRWEQGDSSYINCPFTKEEYYSFVKELNNAKRALLHSFDTKYFESCLPIEVIASRGIETLRHGPLKPFGLAIEGKEKPYAVVQLRQDNAAKTLYNLVGFQTNLKWGCQKELLQSIPALENVSIVRYGIMHRNTFINSPKILNPTLQTKKRKDLFFGGQITGVEGYSESIATGLLAGINMTRFIKGKELLTLSKDTMLGALCNYITYEEHTKLNPINSNWGILPTLEVEKKYRKDKKYKANIYVQNSLNYLKELVKEELI